MSIVSRIEARPSKVTSAKWWEYPVRFLFGGTITAVVGIVGKAYGPAVAGLFLAFPAILPAALTLISDEDGKRPAGVDAIGAALGSIGLMAFGIVVWALAPRASAWLVLAAAAITWAAVSFGAWIAFQRARPRADG